MAWFLREEPHELVMPQPVAAELDYMMTARGGRRANESLLRDLAADRFLVPCLEPADFATISSLNEQYRDLALGLTDLSIVVMAARYRTRRLLSIDQRHFRTIRPLQGGSFVLVPFDEPIPPAR
ncbi:MAG: PIN domain-containing protein [Dehalococcoidia bacterium]